MSKSTGNFKLSTQHDKWGYYGDVRLTLEVSAGFGIDVAFAGADTDWQVGIHFGLVYAYWHSDLMSPRRKARVEVQYVHGHIVDTTELVMAFVAAHAFWDAVGSGPPRSPSLDPATGLFTFPK